MVVFGVSFNGVGRGGGGGVTVTFCTRSAGLPTVGGETING